MSRLGTLLALSVLALGGCSGGDDSVDGDAAPEPSVTTSSSSDVPAGPDCRDIWKTGATLPEDFDTCILDGRTPELDVTDCTDGTRLIVADNLFWARTGGEIKRTEESPLQDTDAYGADWSACTGE